MKKIFILELFMKELNLKINKMLDYFIWKNYDWYFECWGRNCVKERNRKSVEKEIQKHFLQQSENRREGDLFQLT